MTNKHNHSPSSSLLSSGEITHKIDFSSLNINSENYIEFDSGYGDHGLDASNYFQNVTIVENRIPCIEHIKRKISAGINNVTLHTNNLLDFNTNDKYDCVVLSNGLINAASDQESLIILLRIANLLTDNGTMILIGEENQLEEWQSLSSLMGYRYKSSQIISSQKKASFFNLYRPAALNVINTRLKVACYASMPFHFRSLKPLASLFENSLVTLSIDEVIDFKPDVIAIADGWSVEFWRDYCDAHNVQLIGMRHGSVTRYGFAESQYNYADYLCGSPWDIEDTLKSNVLPRKGFVITGNSWVDQVFQIERKEIAHNNPTILFAPTYNPEISAAVFFGERIIDLIRSVYPKSRIIIKPHPVIVQHEHTFVVDKEIFSRLMNKWRAHSEQDHLIELIDNPESSIADSFARADILVADASSLIYEFMTLDRPILLYSTEKKVAHWEYNPNAPGNAWRDIGLEFNNDNKFMTLLRDAFTLHAKKCSKAQAFRTNFLHGEFQDGLSINRVATTIAEHPPLDVIIYGSEKNSAKKKEIAEKIKSWLAFSSITLIDADCQHYAFFSSLKEWQEYLAKQTYHQHHAVLLIDADAYQIPTDAHQITKGLRDLARGRFNRMVLRVKEKAVLTLTSAKNAVSFNPFSKIEDGKEYVWESHKLNVTPAEGVIRNPGQDWFKVRDDARFVLTPSIVGQATQTSFFKLDIIILKKEQYDQFPFTIKIIVNNSTIQEFQINSLDTRQISIPFISDSEGVCNVQMISNARCKVQNDFIDNIAFIIRSEQLSLDDNSSSSNDLKEWLAVRVSSNAEKCLISQYERTQALSTSIACIIILKNSQENVQATLDNIATLNDQPGSLLLKPVIFAFDDIPSDIEDEIESYHLDVQNLPDAINKWVDENSHDWFIILNAGMKMTENGATVARLQLPHASSCAAVYSDVVLTQGNEISSFAFLPDFNLDLLLSMPGIMAEQWLFNRKTFLELGGFSSQWPKAMQFEYITRIIEEKGINVIGHLDEPFIVRPAYYLQFCSEQKEVLEKHLRNRGYDNSTVGSPSPGMWQIKYNIPHNPLITIIIPTKDQLPILITCVTTLIEKTTYTNYEIIIVDNNSEEAETKNWLAGISEVAPERIRVLSYPAPFNYSAINNMAAKEARGEYLVLLNNDTAIIQPDWLENMLNHAQRPEVGIVGAKLLYPNGNVQHAGVILGLRGPADHPFVGRSSDDKGYLNRLIADQNYSVVTAACLMVRKEVYEAAGGLDEELFRVSYNDVDFCLKVRELGFMTVWTPYAKVMHEGSVSQHNVDRATFEAKRKRFEDEQDRFYHKWLPLIAKDPAYNVNLALNADGFELISNSQHTWRPVFWNPVPTVMAHIDNRDPNSSYYRISKPFEAMEEACLIQGKLVNELMNIPQLSQFGCDSFILQNPVTSDAQEWLRRVSPLSQSFKIMELDNYLPCTGQRHASKEMLKAIHNSLNMVDRLVVSTPALATCFDNVPTNIQIIESRLPVREWASLSTLRGQGRKPRIGIATAKMTAADLEIINDVIRALACKVEWIIFGSCSAKLRPYIFELYHDNNIDSHATKLASLNLDLALAPLEDTLFNRCRSNIQLLQYGACSYPVIASDVECYRGNLPVTLVRNRTKDWVEAIEMHLNDLEACWHLGDALRNEVLSSWMLSGDALSRWAKLWLPD